MSILLYCKRCKVKFWDSAPLEKSTLHCTECDEFNAKQKAEEEKANIKVLSVEVKVDEEYEEELPL